MRWQRWSDYALRTSCETFAISKARIAGNWIYTLWRLKPERERLQDFRTVEAAKAAADGLNAGLQAEAVTNGFTSQGATQIEPKF